ncbi:hypothetical protein AK812_SmicGene47574, partial [Symbiodinium microadriaticum]
ELPSWCSERMLEHFAFVEVSGVGAFPEGSEEIDLKRPDGEVQFII